MKLQKIILLNIVGFIFLINVTAGNNNNYGTSTVLPEIYIWPDSVGPGSDSLFITESVLARPLSGTCTSDRTVSNITRPTITPVVPENPNGSAVIICPGGAYLYVVYDVEGISIGEWLNTIGITTFVLKYRLPTNDHKDKKNVPLQDAQRALRYVRMHADEWGLDTSKIGIAGASAGGHAAATLATQFNKVAHTPIDKIDSISARPDFMFLLYPVISMESGITHDVTRSKLIGDSPSQELIDEFSAEKNVTSETPITFMARALDDSGVSQENCVRMRDSLIAAGVQVELKEFKNGGHGVGICKAGTSDFSHWPEYCTNWLHKNGFTEDTAIIADINEISEGSNLFRISPNPISYNSTINFSVKSVSEVNIALFDITGKKVEEIVNKTLTGGDYSLPVGEYKNKYKGLFIIKFSQDQNIATAKVIL